MLTCQWGSEDGNFKTPLGWLFHRSLLPWQNSAVNSWESGLPRVKTLVTLTCQRGLEDDVDRPRDGNWNSLHGESGGEFLRSSLPWENSLSPNSAGPTEMEIQPRLEQWLIKVMLIGHAVSHYVIGTKTKHRTPVNLKNGDNLRHSTNHIQAAGRRQLEKFPICRCTQLCYGYWQQLLSTVTTFC